jgi:uncharacterized protein YjbI with pentapeptide repeats
LTRLILFGANNADTNLNNASLSYSNRFIANPDRRNLIHANFSNDKRSVEMKIQPMSLMKNVDMSGFEFTEKDLIRALPKQANLTGNDLEGTFFSDIKDNSVINSFDASNNLYTTNFN